jgi:hypothetical protein
MPKQKRAWGRPKKNWMEELKKAMNGRNLKEGQWEDRKQWSLCVGQRRKTFQNRRWWLWYSRLLGCYTFFLDCLALDMKALRSSETSGNIYQSTPRNILQQYLCVNLKISLFSVIMFGHNRVM